MKKLIGFISSKVFPYASGTIADPMEKVVTTRQLAKDPELALEMATNLHDAEVRRRQSADTKAALYLAFLAALLPVIGTLTPTVSSLYQNNFLAIDIVLFAMVLIYLLAAGWYAASATTPSVIHLTGETDLSDALEDKDTRAVMASRLIEATRLNYPLNNKKITYVRLTEAHLFRAFLTIILIVAVDWVTDVATLIGEEKWVASSIEAQEICAPLDLKPISGDDLVEGMLQFHLPEVGDAPICFPFSIGTDGPE